MSLLIALLCFLLTAVLLLPQNFLLPKRQLHKLVLLMKSNNIEETEKWTYFDSLLSFCEKLYSGLNLKPKRANAEKYRSWLILADLNDRISLEGFLGLKIVAFAATAAFSCFILLCRPNISTFIMMSAAPFIAYFCPDNLVYGRGKKRQRQMQKELPNVLSTLAIITDSGLNFNDAMKRICESKKGTLISELRKAQKEVEIGELQKNALFKMAERCQLDEISAFVFALTQSIEKGASGVPGFLKEQAKGIWEKRKNKARELGEKASMKLFLPMLILVFPSFLIFIIGPAFISLLKYFVK